jgi:hypothetical protein
MHQIGGCWCAPSYFMGADGVGRVVSSGGSSVITWKLTGTPAKVKLVQESRAEITPALGDPGFFTSVSSNNTGPNSSVIIWAVGRPTDSTNSITLYAFGATPKNGALPLLGKYPAGTWTDDGNANIVPVVANGKVFVASGAGLGKGILTIFGIRP